MNALNPYRYCKYVHYLGIKEGYSRKEFWERNLPDKYWLNIGPVYKDKTINDDHVYNIFGCYSNEDVKTVRKNLAADVTENLEYYQKVLFVVTQMKSTNVASWLEQFLLEKQGDEWTVFCLSRLYNHHTMIHNKKHPWCTIKEGGNLDYEVSCDTHLLYMGNNMYGELLPKSVTCLNLIPNLMPSTPPYQNLQVLLHLKWTHRLILLTVPQVWMVLNFPTQYQTQIHHPLFLQASNNTVTMATCPVHPSCHVDDSYTKRVSDVSTTLAILKRQCKVNLQHLTEAEINEWTIKTHDQPASSSESSTASDSDENMPLSQLKVKVNHSENIDKNDFSSEDDIPLIDFHKLCMRSRTAKKMPISPSSCFPRKSKTGVHYEESAASDDPSDNSPARKKKRVNPYLLPHPSSDHLHAQGYITRNKSKETHNEKEQSDNTQAKKTETADDNNNQDPAQDPTLPKGNLNVTTHGLVKPWKSQRFKCQLCEAVATSRREWNEHHKAEHDKVSCPKCGRVEHSQ